MIGENIRRYRKAKGLSQEELAGVADITYSTLTKIEAGHNRNPTVKTIQRIAEALCVSVDELVAETSEVKTEDMSINIAIRSLMNVVRELRTQYPKKRFTLDGRLVGDLGEVMVERAYDVELYEGLVKHHDAITPDGRNVQIKATMQESLTFPGDHVPDYYIGIQISEDGEMKEIYNGPVKSIAEYLANRKTPKNNLHNVSIRILQKLGESVAPEDRIRRRRSAPH